MVSSSQVPDGLVMRWKHTDRQGRPSPSISGGNTSTERTGRKLRLACELCRSARVRCDGGSPCQRCRTKGQLCQYKASLRSGRMRTRRVHGPSSDTLSATESSPESVIMDLGNAMLSPEIASLPGDTDGGPSNIVPSTNFGVESSAATGLTFPTILMGDLDYLELHDLASRSPLRTLSPAALTYELLGHQPGPVSQAEPAPQSPAFALESPSIPWLGLDTMCERSQKQCSCLKTQLQCIAELCGHVDYDGLKLDQILADARQITQATAQHICCHACQKTPTGLIIFTIALQRAVLMLCHVCRNPQAYLQGLKVAIGNFELSDEDDRDHKRILLMSATDRLEAVVNDLVAAVQKSQQKQQDGQFGSQTARANLDWISGTLQTICRRTKLMNSRLHTEPWGYYTSSTPNDAVQTQKELDIC